MSSVRALRATTLLRVVPLKAIRPSRIQPRSDAASHVESMKPSIGQTRRSSYCAAADLA